jgi:membrane protease YdiL (CAAX protease family)
VERVKALDRARLWQEVVIVLSLSLLASAVGAVISLLTAPVAGVTVFSSDQSGQFALQLANFVFGLAPVALVFYLIRVNEEPAGAFGLAAPLGIGPDAGLGALLGAVVSIAGVGVYLGSVAVHVNRFVVPVPPLGHWWTVPMLVLNSVQAGLIEEVIVVGYLITRLRQVGWTAAAAVGASALLRGSYHLYQGWGGFAGNLLLGLFFGVVFLRIRRTWPLVIGHALVDTLAGVGYLLFRNHLPGL